MKKVFFGAFVLVSFLSCNNSEESFVPNDVETNVSSANMQRACPSEELREVALKSNPELMQRFISNESKIRKFENDLKLGKVLPDGSIEIPVIVNVIYRTAAENVSDARIAEQIAVLNADYSATNSDVNKIPAEFQPVSAGDIRIKFRLVNVVRKSSSIASWKLDDAMKKSTTGGINATNPTNYLNIWVVNKILDSKRNTILGYATFPEFAGLSNDGVVIGAPFFGKTGASAPFNLGRTATHEVGHYLNLRHIWGDAYCGDDLVQDTPRQKDKNYGKPIYPVYNNCTGVNKSIMFMNYMDYVDDAAMFMFSAGQRTRTQATVSSSGPRAGLRVL